MTSVQANEITIEYAETGPSDAPVILLVMGLGMQLIAWPESFCEGLATRCFRVVRFDNRDAGLSTGMPSAGSLATSAMMARAFLGLPVRPPYTLNDMARDTVGLMDTLGIGACAACRFGRKSHAKGVADVDDHTAGSGRCSRKGNAGRATIRRANEHHPGCNGVRPGMNSRTLWTLSSHGLWRRRASRPRSLLSSLCLPPLLDRPPWLSPLQLVAPQQENCAIVMRDEASAGSMRGRIASKATIVQRARQTRRA